jgi:hypothetical protein
MSQAIGSNCYYEGQQNRWVDLSQPQEPGATREETISELEREQQIESGVQQSKTAIIESREQIWSW